mgnify:CR=1 FL=1
MGKFQRKIVACLLILAVFFQPLAVELAAWAANANAAEIAKAKQEYTQTYNDIMALKEVNLGWVGNGIVDLVGRAESAFTGKEKDYIKEIEEANRQIRQAKADATTTMALIQAGDLEAAAATDPSQMASSLAESGGALAKYQEALTKAGSALTAVGNTLGLITTVLTVVCGILTVAAAASVGTLAPVAAPVLVELIPLTGKLGIASALITAAGNSLISSAQKGIVNDANLLGNLAKDVAIEGAKIYIAQKVFPIIGNKISKVVSKQISSTMSKNAANIFSKAWKPKDTVASSLAKKLNFKNLYKNSVPAADPKLYKNLSYLERYSKHVNSKIFEGVIIDSVLRVGSLLIKQPIPTSVPGYAATSVNKALSTQQSKPSQKDTDKTSEINTPTVLQQYKNRTNRSPGLNP